MAVAAKEKFEMLARDENSFEVTRNIFAEIEESVFQQMVCSFILDHATGRALLKHFA